MALRQISKKQAFEEYMKGNNKIYFLKRSRKTNSLVMYQFSEIFKDCRFLSDDHIIDESDECELNTLDNRPKPRGRNIDIGKLTALYQANWRLEDIADEFDVNVQSVRNAINRHHISKIK